MILVDTSVWIDHLRIGNVRLEALLESTRVYSHPYVIGEIALGNLKNRSAILNALQSLPPATVATTSEVMHFIDKHQFAGSGIGYVDASLIASAKLSGLLFWTLDKKLMAAVEKINMGPAFLRPVLEK